MEISFTDMIFREDIIDFQCHFFFLACDHFQHHPAGIKLIAHDNHIGDHQCDHGQQPGRVVISSAYYLRYRDGLDFPGTPGDKGKQDHPDEGSQRQEEGSHADFIGLAGVAHNRPCAYPDGQHCAYHNPR